MAETDEHMHPNLLLMRKYESAWARGDVTEATSYYAEDIVLHLFGRNPLAGEYRGKAAVLGFVHKLLEVTDKIEILENYAILADDRYAVTYIRVRLERAGKKPLEGKRVVVFKLANGKIHDIWNRDEDQYAADEFFS